MSAAEALRSLAAWCRERERAAFDQVEKSVGDNREPARMEREWYTAMEAAYSKVAAEAERRATELEAADG